MKLYWARLGQIQKYFWIKFINLNSQTNCSVYPFIKIGTTDSLLGGQSGCQTDCHIFFFFCMCQFSKWHMYPLEHSCILHWVFTWMKWSMQWEWLFHDVDNVMLSDWYERFVFTGHNVAVSVCLQTLSLK